MLYEHEHAAGYVTPDNISMSLTPLKGNQYPQLHYLMVSNLSSHDYKDSLKCKLSVCVHKIRIVLSGI